MLPHRLLTRLLFQPLGGAGHAVLHMTTKPSFLSRERRLFLLPSRKGWIPRKEVRYAQFES